MKKNHEKKFQFLLAAKAENSKSIYGQFFGLTQGCKFCDFMFKNNPAATCFTTFIWMICSKSFSFSKKKPGKFFRRVLSSIIF
jgi:hypothetical protein